MLEHFVEALLVFLGNQTGIWTKRMGVLVLIIALQLVAVPNMALAKRGGDDDSRVEYYGIVQVQPQSGLHGEWVIGGYTFVTDAGTEFDQSEGYLVVGSCAKVKVRNGRVHEIDSEPMRDCVKREDHP